MRAGSRVLPSNVAGLDSYFKIFRFLLARQFYLSVVLLRLLVRGFRLVILRITATGVVPWAGESRPVILGFGFLGPTVHIRLELEYMAIWCATGEMSW